MSRLMCIFLVGFCSNLGPGKKITLSTQFQKYRQRLGGDLPPPPPYPIYILWPSLLSSRALHQQKEFISPLLFLLGLQNLLGAQIPLKIFSSTGRQLPTTYVHLPAAFSLVLSVWYSLSYLPEFPIE